MMSANQSSDTGVLLGWGSTVTGDRVLLHIQSTNKGAPVKRVDIDQRYLMLSKRQAAQLATHLLQVTQQTSLLPKRKPLLDRLLGA